jgi:hypothetical protein
MKVFMGAYNNWARVSGKNVQDFSEPTAQAHPAGEDSGFAGEARRTWARLLRKILEVNPVLCAAALK